MCIRNGGGDGTFQQAELRCEDSTHAHHGVCIGRGAKEDAQSEAEAVRKAIDGRVASNNCSDASEAANFGGMMLITNPSLFGEPRRKQKQKKEQKEKESSVEFILGAASIVISLQSDSAGTANTDQC